MPTVNKQFAWLSGAETFADVGDSATLAGAFNATDGTPAGSWEYLSSGDGTTTERSRQTLGTWETIFGVPAGATVTRVEVIDYKYTRWSVTSATQLRTRMRVVTTGGTRVHSAGDLVDFLQAAPTSDGGTWQFGSLGSGTFRAVDGAYQASSTSVGFELEVGYTSGVGLALDYELDIVNVTVTYTPVRANPFVAPDFVRNRLQWAMLSKPGQSTEMTHGLPGKGGSLSLRRPTGPHPYGTFERTLFIRLHQDVPAAVGDVTVTADAGNLVLAAAVPAATVQVPPTAGPLVLAGAAPTPSISTVPAAGALVLSAAAPAARLDLSPTAGALTLSAAAPAARVSTVPSAGNLVLTAAAAVTRLDTAPTAGALTLGAAAPSATISTAPTVGPLALSAAAPTAQATVPPAAGNLILTAAAPTIVTAGNITISPTAGDLTLGAAAPQTELRAIPATGAITLAGAAATLTLTAAPTPGNLILGAGTPTLTGAAGPTIRPVEDIAPVYVTF